MIGFKWDGKEWKNTVYYTKMAVLNWDQKEWKNTVYYTKMAVLNWDQKEWKNTVYCTKMAVLNWDRGWLNDIKKNNIISLFHAQLEDISKQMSLNCRLLFAWKSEYTLYRVRGIDLE